MAISFKNPNVAIAISATTVYTCPAATESVVFTLNISNVDGVNDATVTVEVYDDSTATTRVLGKDIIVPADNTLVWEGKIALEANDILKCTASAANDLEAYASVMEKT